MPANAGEACSVALRPEVATIGNPSIAIADGKNRMVGNIEEVSFLGSVVRIRVRFAENTLKLDTFNNPNAAPPEGGAQVAVTFAREDVLVLEGGHA